MVLFAGCLQQDTTSIPPATRTAPDPGPVHLPDQPAAPPVLLHSESLPTTPPAPEKFAATGDIALIDLTIWDATGRPVLTTNEQIYAASTEKGDIVWFTVPLTMKVNIPGTRDLLPVPSSSDLYGQADYALFTMEVDTIAKALVDMRKGETKKITFEQMPGFERMLTVEQFNAVGGNFATSYIGDQMMLAFSGSSRIDTDEPENLQYAVRTGYLTQRTVEFVTINYGYPRAEISIRELISQVSP